MTNGKLRKTAAAVWMVIQLAMYVSPLAAIGYVTFDTYKRKDAYVAIERQLKIQNELLAEIVPLENFDYMREEQLALEKLHSQNLSEVLPDAGSEVK